MMRDMKERVSLSLDTATTAYLSAAAAKQTGGNVSALVDLIVRTHALREAIEHEARWYAANPGVAEAAEVERQQSGAA
jgi:hypothetical protein